MNRQAVRKICGRLTLIAGNLLVLTLGPFVLARVTAANTQQQWLAQTMDYQDSLGAGIVPMGRVVLPGYESAQSVVRQVAVAEPVAESLSGPQVYNDACVACHGSGIGGAPRLGDLDAWRSRIAQGQDVLTDHVINGYTGDAGYMPPKGGRVDLSDAEILAAMAYLLDESS